MTTRIIVPSEAQLGLDAQVAQHFGRAPYFVVVDLDDTGQVSSVENELNTGEHAGGMGSPHDILLSLKPNVIAVYGMGPRGLLSFEHAGVTVLKTEGKTVKEVVAAFKEGKLKELEGGCEHAHHH